MAIKNNPTDQEIANHLIKCIDLTCLTDNAGTEENETLCQQAFTPTATVAAICVWPQFITPAKAWLKKFSQQQQQLPAIATVINFPEGENKISSTISEIDNALTYGADELDIVMPYKMILDNQEKQCQQYMQQCMLHIKQHPKLKNKKILKKIIIESGALNSPDKISLATKISMECGADFIKTSTGKTTVGATIEAVTSIAQTIKNNTTNNHKKYGLKISGGVATFAQAKEYYRAVCETWGEQQISPDLFRIGASRLLQELIQKT